MPLLDRFHQYVHSESKMQERVVFLLLSKDYYSREQKEPRAITELHIPSIHRRSDIVLFFTKRRIVNIECKLSDVKTAIRQAKDHLKWANYSYVCMPASAYIKNSERLQMINLGIGLLLLSGTQLIEAIHPRVSTYKTTANRENRKDALAQIDKHWSRSLGRQRAITDDARIVTFKIPIGQKFTEPTETVGSRLIEAKSFIEFADAVEVLGQTYNKFAAETPIGTEEENESNNWGLPFDRD